MSGNNDMSYIRAWLLAVRPKILPAALSSVLIGTAKAIADQSFAFLPAFAALM